MSRPYPPLLYRTARATLFGFIGLVFGAIGSKLLFWCASLIAWFYHDNLLWGGVVALFFAFASFNFEDWGT